MSERFTSCETIKLNLPKDKNHQYAISRLGDKLQKLIAVTRLAMTV